MNRTIIILSLAALLAGCGESRLNPFNWFGGGSAPVEKVELPTKPADTRAMVSHVSQMFVEPLPSGVLVRAVGQTPTQGWWDADLVAQPVSADGTLVLEFRIFPPIDTTAVNTPQSREVMVATHLSNIKLANVNRIVVQGANDARSAGR